MRILSFIGRLRFLILSLLLLALLAFVISPTKMTGVFSVRTFKADIINAYFPFRFRSSLDPRSIFAVGEQVMAEYIFAFHAKTGQKTGFQNLMSKVSLNESSNRVQIEIEAPIYANNGKEIPFQGICEGIKSSLNGTRHASYSSILKRVDCRPAERIIDISFTKIPINLKFLLTLPDFSIFAPEELPLNLEKQGTSAGPYRLSSVTSERVTLEANKFYPNKLRANQLDAELLRYSPDNTREFIQAMRPETHHSAYFFGHALEPADVQLMQEKGYVVELFPTEWFVYLVARGSGDKELASALREQIDLFRESELKKVSLGLPAYSIAPTDRPFALSKADYEKNALPSLPGFDFNKKFKVATLSSWVQVSFNSKILAFLKKRFPNMEVEEIALAESGRLFSGEYDVSLALLGISPSDPLTHLSFFESTLAGFSELVSKEEIASLSIETEPEVFYQRLKDVERRIKKSGLIIPIAHFPGVVAHRADLKRDESIAFGWGIQTWSFRVD